MGGIASRDAGEEEIDTASTNAYRYPPKIGKKWKIYCKFRCIPRKARLKQRNWIVFAQMKQETSYIFTVSCIMSLEYDILLPKQMDFVF